MNTKNFKLGLRKLASKAVWLAAIVVVLGGLASSGRAQTSFATAQVISGDWGSVTNDNIGVSPDLGAPNIAGFAPNAPLWYKWTADLDGEVELDTVGSDSGLDTVLGVFTGTDVRYLNQIAANDDLYPVNLALAQIQPGFSVLNPESVTPAPELGSFYFYSQPYYGPSHLRFTARNGQTYYFAVDTKSLTGHGIVSLSWAYKSSGVFRFASEDMDILDSFLGTPVPLYQTAQTESQLPLGFGIDRNSVVGTYYNYNAPGVLVTVTRTAGSKGRVSVDYSTVDGTDSLFGFDVAAHAYYTNIVTYVDMTGAPTTDPFGNSGFTNLIAGDYSPVSGTLVFDDFEMSKTILIPINASGGYLENPSYSTNVVISRSPFRTISLGRNSSQNNLYNAVFGVVLSNAQPDPLEAGGVSAPRVDPVFSLAKVKILNSEADPYGPDMVAQITSVTNVVPDPNNPGSYVTNIDSLTNLVLALYPTNNVFNFEKATYRVPADVTDPAIAPYNWADVTLYVERFGTNTSAETIHYRVNNFLSDSLDAEEYNNEFPLQPGSDYAVPLAANNKSSIRDYADTNFYDFDVADGTISFPSTGAGANSQPIHIKIPVSTTTKFNKDFRVQLYRTVNIGGRDVVEIPGMNSEATVTILFNDENPPAGSVDEFYNADFNDELAVLASRKPATTPDNNSNPGVGSPLFPGQVYGMALLANDEAFIGGDFPTYNGTARNGVALVNTNGQLDTSFDPGTGISGDITQQGIDSRVNAVGVSGNQFYIGGNFTAYNGQPVPCVARLNADGSLDTTFNTGTGPDGTVRAVAVLPNGEIMVGGDFSHINDTPCNYIALLNANGAVDTSFNPGTLINGPVYALALPQLLNVNFNLNSAVTGTNEVDTAVNLGLNTAATLAVNYDMLASTNDMRVFYGDTNTAAGTGVLIYDTGSVGGAGAFVLPFGPTNGLATNVITIVMNQGGGQPGTFWSYSASITGSSTNLTITAGGNFTVNGQTYKNIVQLNGDGSLNTSFHPLTGADGIIHTLEQQPDGKIIAGGEFTHVNGFNYNHVVRFNGDGTIDTTNFFVGTGADDIVYTINLRLDGTIYLGGAFQTFNGTRRSGFTRLYANGTVDTTFMDTAYNQFAGIKKIYSTDPLAIFTSAVQSDGGVLIGGSFLQVGGGQASTNVCNTLDDELFYPENFGDTNLWVEPKARDGVRNRTGFARLIGGATPGPGNVGLSATSYSQNKSQSSLTVGLVRTNGTLGPVSANFFVQPGLALAGQDYKYQSASPLFWIAWNYLSNPSRQREDGLWGASGSLIDALGLSLPLGDKVVNNLSVVTVSVIKNAANPGNLNAQFQLANPSLADTFYLGGEGIPLGTALGASGAQFNLIDDTTYPGQFGFQYPAYVATNTLASITLVRSNGTFGAVSMRYWATNGTAIAGQDFRGLTNQPLIFNTGVTSTNFNVTILNNGAIANVEKTVNLRLGNLGTTPGATFGITNAVLRIINPNFQGYVTLGASNYSGAVSAGTLNFVVNRVVGSYGSASVNYATADGSAVSGMDYIGSTNTLTWNNGDVSPKTVSIPLLNPGVVGTNKQFSVALSSPTNLLMGIISNAVLTINNDNRVGTIQFSSPSYIVNEDGGYATITVIRIGGAAGTISAHYVTSDGTATNGVNYVATNGTVNLASGQTSASFTIPILNDGVSNPPPANFYFNLSLVGPGTLTNAIVEIVDASGYHLPPGSPTDFDTNSMINGDVFALALQNNTQILAVGNFTAVGPVPEGRIARFNADGTLDTSFLSDLSGANAAVNTVACQTDGRILVGGAFTTVDDINRNFIARLMTDGTLDTSFNPGSGADGVVNAVAESFAVSGTNMTRKIYIGGAFGSVNTAPSRGVARLNNDGSVDFGFNVGSGADGQVFAIEVYPTNSLYAGKVLVGGAFTRFNGLAITNLARLNADGSLDTSFNAGLGFGPDGAVRALAIQPGGEVLVGGNFVNFNGTALNHIARLNTDGTLDNGFVTAVGPGVNDTVEGIAVQPDNRIILVGQFTLANGVTRNHITRLLPTGATDPTINFGTGANGDVAAVVMQPADNNLVIGGAFTQYDGQPHSHIAGIYGRSLTGSGVFTFAAADFFADEDGIVAPITIERTGGTSGTNADFSGDVFVNFATVGGGSAVAGVNFLGVSTNVDFPAGEVSKTVYVPVLDDFVITTNLTVDLALSNPTPPASVGVQQPTATLHIVNVDSAVCFSNVFYTQSKNTPIGAAVIDVLRIGGTNNTCSVEFATDTNGTAVIGTDYYPTNVTLTFLPGQSDLQARVPIINNTLPEGNKTVGLVLANAANVGLTSPSNAVLTIIDTVAAPGQLYFSATNFAAGSGDGYAYLPVLRTNGSSGTVSVNYNFVAGTAAPGVNYVDAPGTVTFGPGTTSVSVPVQLVNNSVVQGPVSLSVVLSSPTGGATLTAPTTTALTILNTNVGFAFLNATNYVRETNGFVPIYVQRLGGTNGGVQVSYSTTAGTALPGVNYNNVSGALTFGAGEMLKVISLPLIYDPQVTGNLLLTMRLSSPSAGTVLASPSNAVVVVQDADAGVSFTNATMSVYKNVGVAAIPVVCTNTAVEPAVLNTNTVPMSVHYATANGTAVAGVDYQAVSGVLYFTNGIGTNYIYVPIYNNSQVLGDHNFTVSLSSPTAPAQLVPPATQVVTIVDNNSGLSFSSPIYSVLKTGVAATITVVRTDFTNTTSSVNFATSDGTAVAGLDYIATNGTFTFTNGETSKTFNVTVIANTTVQPDKTVLLQLSSPVNGFLIAPYAATLTIHDTTGSLVVPAGSTFAPGGDPNNNGIIDPGENVTLLVGLRASGGTNVNNLSATLLATNGITSPSAPGGTGAATQNYGTLVVNGPSVSRPFSFTASGTNSQTITATYQLKTGSTSIGTATFTYTLGAWTTMFYNSNSIVINDKAIASPYPSGIQVSNVGGVLIKAAVTLTNLYHGYTKDIEALVVSPAGQDTLLMGHAGNASAAKLTLTFEDGAARLSSTNALTSGTNQPTAFQPITTFP